MTILIVEDDLARAELFTEALRGHTIYLSKTVDRALQWLKEGVEFDTIFLDHDLLDHHYSDHPELIGETLEQRYNRIHNHPGTGREVALFLRDNPSVCKDARIIIHSMNRTASEMMRRDLESRSADKLPFPVVMLTLLQNGDKGGRLSKN
jgi:CheY-like chemotaxis protein